MVVSQGACRSPFFSSPAAPTSPSVPAHHCLPPAAPAHTAAHFLPLHRPVRERVKREKEAEDGADEGEADECVEPMFSSVEGQWRRGRLCEPLRHRLRIPRHHASVSHAVAASVSQVVGLVV
uniref:Uncharacterized protein n=1 Tax=Oryza sativa subsp. japonica TaxID=39947 RepID=Q850S4_ORYSJ|nr:hypothetical protein [Oryza sativa Japonica Group]